MQALLALLVLASPVCAKDPTQGPNGGQAPKVDKPLSIDEAVDRYSEIISGVQPSSLWSGDISALLDAINKVKSEHQTVEGIETAIPAIRLFLQQNGKIPPPQPPPGAKPGAPQPPHAGETAARELAGRFPGDPQLRITGGAYAFERKDYETALRDYEHAVAIDPANRTAMLGYGVSAYELGDYALALKAAKQMLARDRRDADALGLYHFANGRAPTVSLPSAIFRDDGGAPAPAMAAAAPAAYSAAPAA
jgi:tetratricopeptide (TPR) repeat protein